MIKALGQARTTSQKVNLSVLDFLFGSSHSALYYSLNWPDLTPNELSEELSKWNGLGPLGKAHLFTLHTWKTSAQIKWFSDHTRGILLKRENATWWNS